MFLKPTGEWPESTDTRDDWKAQSVCTSNGWLLSDQEGLDLKNNNNKYFKE